MFFFEKITYSLSAFFVFFFVGLLPLFWLLCVDFFLLTMLQRLLNDYRTHSFTYIHFENEQFCFRFDVFACVTKLVRALRHTHGHSQRKYECAIECVCLFAWIKLTLIISTSYDRSVLFLFFLCCFVVKLKRHDTTSLNALRSEPIWDAYIYFWDFKQRRHQMNMQLCTAFDQQYRSSHAIRAFCVHVFRWSF